LNWFKELTHAWLDVFTLPGRITKRAWSWFTGLGARRAAFFVLSAVVTTTVLLTTFVKITSQPQFCVSCHIMEPYFDAWEVSAHSDVQCIKCHIEPGIVGTLHGKFVAVSMLVNYATGLYKRSKPWAEIPDASCLQSGCHDTRLLQGTVDFKGVKFDHAPHLTQTRRDRQLRCTSCHANIVQGSHISVTESTCFLCHLKPDSTGQLTDLANCLHCHTPPTGEAAIATFDHEEILTRGVECANCHFTDISGDGYVPPIRCNNCHAQLQHIERYDDRDFVHQMHVTDHKVECEECHIPIRHGRDARQDAAKELRCKECHGGGINAMQKVWDGTLPGVETTPSVMASVGMVCNSCHIEPIHRPDGTFATPDCERCHEQGYDRLWTFWKEPIEKSLKKMERALTKMPAATQDTLREAISIYRAGNPVHNPDLLMALGQRILGEPTNVQGAECMTCHPSPSELAPSWNKRQISHSKHLDHGLTCRKCHDPDGEPHGRLVLTQSQCSSCHHGEFGSKVGDCQYCHTTQFNTFAGNVPGFDEELPNIMFEAELACTDCHGHENNHVSRDVGPMCVECHDDDYGEMLVQWQQFGDSLLTASESRMRELRYGTDLYNEYDRLTKALRNDRSRTAHNPELFQAWMEKINAVQ
jgi:nitrate/TMAO reductase-like tetraheme cytochrome c subunit